MVRSLHGDLQGCGIGHAGTVEAGRVDALLLGQGLDLFRRSVDDHDTNVQRPQQSQVEEDVGEIFVSDDTSVECDDKGLFAELRNVLENPAQVGKLHIGTLDWMSGGLRPSFKTSSEKWRRFHFTTGIIQDARKSRLNRKIWRREAGL